MKKSTNLSLIAALVLTSLTSSALAGDSLSDAFINGKFKGELKSFYFARGFEDGGAKEDASLFVNGGSMNYITDSFKGFKLGATMQTSHITSDDDETNAYKKDMNASASQLSESYLQYNLGKTTFKAGRQYINTALIAGSPARMIRESFEGYTLTNTSIPKTKIEAGYLTKFQARTDLAGGVGEFTNKEVGIDGTWSLYVKNNSIQGLNLAAQYYKKSEVTENADNGLSNLFLNSIYTYKSDFKPFIGVQYYKTMFDDNAKTDNDLVGAKVGFTVKGVTLFSGYTKTGTGSKVEHGMGASAWKHFTASTAYGGENAFSPDTESLQFGIKTKIGPVAVKLLRTEYDVENNGATVKSAGLKETALGLKYKFNGALKNLVAIVDYVDLDSELNGQQNSELRTRFIYKF